MPTDQGHLQEPPRPPYTTGGDGRRRPRLHLHCTPPNRQAEMRRPRSGRNETDTHASMLLSLFFFKKKTLRMLLTLLCYCGAGPAAFRAFFPVGPSEPRKARSPLPPICLACVPARTRMDTPSCRFPLPLTSLSKKTEFLTITRVFFFSVVNHFLFCPLVVFFLVAFTCFCFHLNAARPIF